MLLALLGVGLAPASSKDRNERRERDDDHERAREAVERVEMRPLAEILTLLRKEVPGEVVGVEVERERGVWIYELKVVDSAGRLREVYVDGATGRVLKLEDK